MRRILLSLAAAMGLVTAAQAQDVTASLKGPAAESVARYLKQTRIPCYTQKGEGKCPIIDTAADASLFHGRFENDPTPHAVAFVGYQYDQTGTAVSQMAIVFRKAGGRWVPVGRVDETIGSEPRQVQFGRGIITYVGTVLGPKHPRANPTGRGRFSLKLTDHGVIFSKEVH
ncbi:hypothetical protein [Bosea sp. (in: a-proteobacteria)]|uniref:hypothetical protein n=1 Tax=Bosea sp. (in: a-proteobacteria) TaxID=1871050 RepID=UPI002DDCFFD4|nr:hypothetical protein [Bosea sp. (in: a-proteobacteria)]